MLIVLAAPLTPPEAFALPEALALFVLAEALPLFELSKLSVGIIIVEPPNILPVPIRFSSEVSIGLYGRRVPQIEFTVPPEFEPPEPALSFPEPPSFPEVPAFELPEFSEEPPSWEPPELSALSVELALLVLSSPSEEPPPISTTGTPSRAT